MFAARRIVRVLSVLLIFKELERKLLRADLRRQEAATERWLNVQLDINRISDDDCKRLFRFTSSEIDALVSVFRLGDVVWFREDDPKHRFKVNSKEAMMILLRRLAYPSLLSDLKLVFKKDESTIDKIFNGMIQLLMSKFSRAMTFDENQFREANLKKISKAIEDAGAVFSECVRFIDKTFIRCARPRHVQHLTHNDRFKCYGIKYQAIVTPDGITSSLSKAITGNHLFEDSEIEEKMKQFFDVFEEEDKCYHLYGTAAYQQSLFMERTFETDTANSEELLTNKLMSKLQVCTDYEFARARSLFAYLKFWRELHPSKHPIGAYYTIATLLKNARVCLDGGNKTSQKFGCSPPSLTTYISSLLEQNERMVVSGEGETDEDDENNEENHNNEVTETETGDEDDDDDESDDEVEEIKSESESDSDV